MSMGIIESGEYNKVAGLGGGSGSGSGEVIIHDPSEIIWGDTDYLTPNVSTGGLVEKDGIVQFTHAVWFSSNFPVETGTIICRGLPKPAVYIEAPLSCNNAEAYGYLSLDTEGNLYATMQAVNGVTGYFNITYIKAAED